MRLMIIISVLWTISFDRITSKTSHIKGNLRHVHRETLPRRIRDQDTVLTACNEICSCTKKKRSVDSLLPGEPAKEIFYIDMVCDELVKVKKMNHDFEREELEGSTLKVSDDKFETIDISGSTNEKTIVFDDSKNGLKGVHELELNNVPTLKYIGYNFFTEIFPGIRKLFLGESNIAYLILTSMTNVTTFIVRSPTLSSISCQVDSTIVKVDPKHLGCFHPLKMDYIEIYVMGAIYKNEENALKKSLFISGNLFPSEVTTLKLVTDKNLAFQNVKTTFEQLTLEIGDTSRPMDLSKVTVTETFTFGYKVKNVDIAVESIDTSVTQLDPILQKEIPYQILSSIYRNPSLKNHLVIKDFPSTLFPIILPTCFDSSCDDESPVLNEVVEGEICSRERGVLKETNPTDEELRAATEGTIWYRGFEVDLTELIDKIETAGGEGERKTNLLVIVNAYHLYISGSRKISFQLKAYYTVLQTKKDKEPWEKSNQVIYRNWYDKSKPMGGTSYDNLPAFAVSLSFAEKVDATFMQAYSKCAVSMIAAYREKSSFTDLLESRQWKMYLAFPKVVQEYAAADKFDSNRAATMHELVTRYLSKLVEEERTVSRVPYLSMNLQGESTEILLQMARDFQTSKNQFLQESKLEDIEDQSDHNLKTLLEAQDNAQINELEISRQKAISLGEISARKRDDIGTEKDKVTVAIEKLEKVSLEVQSSVTTATKEFEDGSNRRQLEAYAEVGMAVAGTFISLFTGGFDPNKIANAARKLKTIITKLTQLGKIMKLIKRLIEKLKSIRNLLKSVKGGVNTRITKLFSNLKKLKEYCSVQSCSKQVVDKTKSAYNNLATSIPEEQNTNKIKSYNRYMKRATKLKDVGDGLLAISFTDKAQKAGFDPMPGFDPSEHMKAIDEGKSMDVADVVQWDMTRDQVEGLLDASLSAEVPETTSYKAALFKFATVGKAITQLQIDEVKLGDDYATADFTYLKHTEDYVLINHKLTELKNAAAKRRSDRSTTTEKLKNEYTNILKNRERKIFWEEFLTKLELVSNNVEFCNAYAYFHLETCPPELQFNVLDSLEKITQTQTQLLYYSKQELRNLYPPPQAFYNISMFFQDEINCECAEVSNPPVSSESSSDSLPTMEELKRAMIKKCFPERSEPFTEKDEKDTTTKLLKCNMKYITTFKREKTLSWSIPINSKDLFQDYERVRLDKLQIYLHGAKTDNGLIRIDVQNAGVSFDRLKGRVYKFYGEPWIREFSYYNEQNVKGRGTTNTQIQKPSITVSTEVHKQFDGIFRAPTGFSTWTLEISDAKNPGLDLSGLTKIEIIYSGSFIIGSTDYTTYDLEGFPTISSSATPVDSGEASGPANPVQNHSRNRSLKHKRKYSKKHHRRS